MRSQLAFVLAAIGGGLLIYGALKWWQLPHYSESDIASSIELNLTLDLTRVDRDHSPSPAEIETMRQGIRGEIEAEIAKDHEEVRNWLTGGAVLLGMALAQLLTQRYLARGRLG